MLKLNPDEHTWLNEYRHALNERHAGLKNPPDGWPRIVPAVFYNDAAAAIDWLPRAFGFAVREKDRE